MYKDILCEDFVEQYKSYHMTLFRELNIMLFDVAFLKECVSQSGRMLDADIVVLYLFKNTFEHLILNIHYQMFLLRPRYILLLSSYHFLTGFQMFELHLEAFLP